ncbi:TetR/AcrR family transcriptional regulator [Herbiconiux sp. P15]|uniref:TetR/AcrR family transcriptional regulator n=1 Tax=Herbiconiux liukaitaii TaxID=3342799 RepID=UPI0035B7073D
MPRPIDPEKYESRRAAIVTAASTEFATHGYQASTTAGICREAGISSGTFFHYFPTKLDALVAVLESGCDDLRDHLARIEQNASGLEAVLRYATALGAEVSEESYRVFVAGLAGVESDPRVAAALQAEATLIDDFLARHVEAGQQTCEIRRDAPASDLARWVSWLLDGASQAAAVAPAPMQTPATVESLLRGGIHALLDPR